MSFCREGKSHSVVLSFIMSNMMHVQFTYRTTMYTEYCVLSKAYEDAGNKDSKLFTYNHFCSSWCSFLNLFDIDVKKGFICERCGAQPDIVPMNATSLAFRRDVESWQVFLHSAPQVKFER